MASPRLIGSSLLPFSAVASGSAAGVWLNNSFDVFSSIAGCSAATSCIVPLENLYRCLFHAEKYSASLSEFCTT